MKTKLVLTIKVDELDEDTTPLYLALAKGKALKISDIFDPNQEVIATTVGDMHAVRNGGAILNNCGNNPQYDAWLTQDRAMYPDLYDE